MSNQVLQTEINKLRSEIRALKVGSDIPSKLRTYTWGPEFPPALEIEVIYGDGDQPILSEFYTGSTTMPEKPSGNSQRVHMYSQVPYELFIASTRPILEVRGI